MYKLYYSPGACSMAVHAVLNEIGADYEAINVNKPGTKTRTPEFLAINSRGSVPTLLIDGKVMKEGGAILTYLCDTHKSKLLPASGWERAQALQWLMFCNSTLHPAYSRMFWVPRVMPEGQPREDLAKVVNENIQQLWNEVGAHLEKQGTPFLAGKEITVGDILLSVIANWNAQAFKFGPKTKAIFKSVSSLPFYQKALKAENIEYKAAA
jgi:glutathione S-transferase